MRQLFDRVLGSLRAKPINRCLRFQKVKVLASFNTVTNSYTVIQFIKIYHVQKIISKFNFILLPVHRIAVDFGQWPRVSVGPVSRSGADG